MRPKAPSIVLASIVITVIAVLGVIFFYRLSILQYTAETIIRNALPDYVSVEKVSFDIAGGSLTLSGFSVLNPPGYISKHLLEIGEISCRYRMKGKSVLDGLEITEGSFKEPVIYLERRRDARLNINDMSAILAKDHPRAAAAPGAPTVSKAREEARLRGVSAGRAYGSSAMLGSKKLSDIIKLPDSYGVRAGRLVFRDDAAAGGTNIITFDDISADISLKLNDSYTGVLGVSSAGVGFLNGDKGQSVRWVIDYKPGTPRLTMSNRFEVSGVALKPLEPYYDRYSPLAFKSGRFSGTLIFDFDNGNIGSTNEIRLSGLSFSVKPGQENGLFLGAAVPDLVKYFTTSTGDIVFDFKIKGDMASPKFFLGPSKRAITSMVVDKISQAISAAAEASEPGAAASGDSKEAAQAKAIANTIKMLLKKQ